MSILLIDRDCFNNNDDIFDPDIRTQTHRNLWLPWFTHLTFFWGCHFHFPTESLRSGSICYCFCFYYFRLCFGSIRRSQKRIELVYNPWPSILFLLQQVHLWWQYQDVWCCSCSLIREICWRCWHDGSFDMFRFPITLQIHLGSVTWWWWYYSVPVSDAGPSVGWMDGWKI